MSREQPRGGLLRTVVGRRLLVVLALTVLCALWTAPEAAADDPAFTVDANGVGTVTGIAADTGTQTYWVTEAGGDQGSVHGLSDSGQEKGSFGFRADVDSVQALAYHDGRLYVGDIGDPRHDRDFITVYFFADVAPGDGVITYSAWDFRYPDGERDAKAMVVDDTGRLYLITTGSDAGVYAAPQQPSRQGVNELTRVGDAPSGAITDAVALDADRWALRTKDTVEVIDSSTYEVTAKGPLPVSDGQALGTSLTGSDLLAVENGASPSVFALSAPTTIASPTPTASPTPSATPTSTASADHQPTGSQEHTGAERRTGTWVAIGLAAALAVLAGLAAYFVVGRRGGAGQGQDESPEADGDETATNATAATSAAAATNATDETAVDEGAAEAGGAPGETTAPSSFQPLAPLPASGLPDHRPDDLPTAPATPNRSEYGAARSAGLTDPDDTVRPPRRAREPGDIEDDDEGETAEPDDDDLDQTVLRSSLPRHGEASDETVRRPPRRGGRGQDRS